MSIAVDPRRETPSGAGDVRPVVGTASSALPIWVMAAGLMLFAVVLFAVLDGKRRAASAPPVRARNTDTVAPSRTAVPLFVPPAPLPAPVPPVVAIVTPPVRRVPPQPRFVSQAPPGPRIVYLPQPPTPGSSAPATRDAGAPVVVLDVGGGAAAAPPSAANPGGDTLPTAATARATVQPNRTTTVPQGTLIPAVLESALDSTRPGLARAVVSRDVRGFDGSMVLVPRGSRLVGTYRANVMLGQNRALITWTRLVRPDGVAIEIGSPAADTLGRAGVRGKVDSHFFARFGAAILQSTLDVGVNLASRLGNSNSATIVALPGASQALSQPLSQAAQVPPTLRVRQGTSISVFVARDLDFTGVDNPQ